MDTLFAYAITITVVIFHWLLYTVSRVIVPGPQRDDEAYFGILWVVLCSVLSVLCYLYPEVMSIGGMAVLSIEIVGMFLIVLMRH